MQFGIHIVTYFEKYLNLATKVEKDPLQLFTFSFPVNRCQQFSLTLLEMKSQEFAKTENCFASMLDIWRLTLASSLK